MSDRADGVVREVLRAQWFANPDDLIGGWQINTADKRTSELQAGEWQVGDFLDRRLAEHIVQLHNEHLVQEVTASESASPAEYPTMLRQVGFDTTEDGRITRVWFRQVFEEPDGGSW